MPSEYPSGKQETSFLQSPFWAEFKKAQGWDSFLLCMEGVDEGLARDNEDTGGDCPDATGVVVSVLVRRIMRFFRLAYVPLGPQVSRRDPLARGELLSAIAEAARPLLPHNTVFVRFDPPWTCAEGTLVSKREAVVSGPRITVVRKASVDIQPPDTVIVDLSRSENEILESMKPKWRYNVRLAEKKGVTVRRFDGKDALACALDEFYRLYVETAKRDGIAIHSRTYYSRLFETTGPHRVSVYLAESGGTAIASIITLCHGTCGTYLYGASSNEGRNLMPAYVLQWKAMLDAKEAGCVAYDMYGIPPDDDPTHPMHGLYRFKTGFGGAVVHRVGSHDVPLMPLAYGAYALAERARSFWFKKIVKAFRRGIRRTSSI